MKKILVIIAGAMFLLPAFATAQGLIGECADCHTMHNSEQGVEVARVGIAGTLSETPNANLLKYDCIACHAMGTANAVEGMTGGSQIPQVLHTDTAANELASGNFRYVTSVGNRAGHNIPELGLAVESDNVNSKAIDNGALYAVPPGQYYGYQDGHGKHLSSDINTGFDKFTCAGAGGCHGTRSQFLATAEYVCQAADIGVPGNICETAAVGDVIATAGVPRTGMAAISGSHHLNYDGDKTPTQVAVGEHDGSFVADSYRFLNGVQGYGNETTNDRWQNASATSHNEYFGVQAAATTVAQGCDSCHVTGTDVGLSYTNNGVTDTTSSRMTLDSSLQPPNQSMSGFCTTCHGNFHSSSLEDGFNYDRGPYNGASGAFLRHPSDYVIPNSGEYAAFIGSAYNINAPVARPAVATAVGGTVVAGDMVMCLSCHKAHASEHEGMLRFDYALQIAGNTTTGAGQGCVACHTNKGVSQQP